MRRLVAMLVLAIAGPAAAGCVQTRQQNPRVEWQEIADKIWDAVEKHQSVWIDSMELADGKQIDLKIRALDPATTVTGAKYGVVLKCHIGGLDVKAMTAFRRELKEDPMLSRHFPIVHFDTQWKVVDQKDAVEKSSLSFDVILVNTGQS